MIGGIVGVGSGKALGTDSFSRGFGYCVGVTKCHHSGLWRHGLW